MREKWPKQMPLISHILDNPQSQEKVVSIFAPHTDVFVKDRRDPICGHKNYLAGGASNLILDCLITEGNSTNLDLVIPMLDRQKDIYGRYPLKVCFDGGFASKDHLKKTKAKPRNIKAVSTSKLSVLPKSAVLKKPICAAVNMGTIAFDAPEPGLSPVSPGSNAPWDLPLVCGKAGMRLSPISGHRLLRPIC